MNRYAAVGFGSLATLMLLGAAGCAADATGGSAASESGKPAGASATAQADVILAELTPEKGHTVTFRQLAGGELLVQEEGEIGQKPVVPAGKPVLEIYRAVSGGKPAPAALVDAYAAQSARAPAPAVTEAPKESARLKVEGTPVTGTDQWFQNTFCTSYFSTDCEYGNNSTVVTRWDAVGLSGRNSFQPNMQGYAFNAGAYTSTMGINRWNGSAWATLFSEPITTGRWQEVFWWTPSPSYFQVFETPSGGDEGVDIWGFTPHFDDATYYSNGNLIFDGEQFANDSQVKLTISAGSLSEVVGTYSTTTSGSTPGVFNDDNTGNFIYCSPYSSPGSLNATLTAVGVQTGQVASTGVTLTNCSP